MKGRNSETHRRFILLSLALAFFSIGICTAQTTPPDLTAAGAITTLKADTNATPVYGETYNLGATGLRGWIWIDRNNMGDTGRITDQSRQILVTHCVAPASALLAVDDVILGAIAASSGTVPAFTSDCRKAFASAITDAEKVGAGTLRVKRWRAGTVTEQNITLPILGNYSVTAPFSCPKSSLILDNVRNKMVADLLANSNYLTLTDGFRGSSNALALLSGVKSGDPNYDEVQTRLQTYARSLASAGPVNDGLPIWSWSYNLIFLSEYYLITGDSQVVPGIQSFTLKLAQSQSIYGTYGHGPSALRLDGSGRRVSTGYGPVNAVGGTAAIALVMGKKALVAASQSINPEIDAAIQRSSSFFAFFVNKGGIPYGEHEPSVSGHGSNGKDAMPAVFFGLQSGRSVETEYFSRISIAGWIGREYGHTGQGLSYYWTTLGALMGGPDAASEYLKPVRWHLDLSRRTDGSFAYDGQEQYGPGTTSDNTYLGPAEYYGMTANAMYLLTYSLPLQRLWITGKSANPAYTLNSTKIAAAVSAGSFRLDRSTKTVTELFTAIGDYDPIVRNYASIELASRTLSSTNLTNLRNLLSSADPNLRQSACQTLGIRKDSTALPTIVTLLNDSNIWARAKAATAIREYPSATASTHRDAMMTSFIANATNPDVIDWTDPIQMGNGKLSLALFGNGVPDGTPGNNIADYTINASKQSLLYPALRAGLKQPDSYPRLGAVQFSRTRLPLTDTQALYPDVEHVAAYDTPADRMWSSDCRDEAITLLANMKIADGIPLALSMLEVPYDFAWGSGTSKVAALKGLAAYGDAARYTIPSLKNYLTQWDSASAEYAQLVTTINTLENAITAPAQNLGLAVANSQIVTTTGAKAITLTGTSPRGALTFTNVTAPAHGTLTGTAPNLTYTPSAGYTGTDKFTFQVVDSLTTSKPGTVAIIVGSSGNGILGEYFNNADFTSQVLTRTDPQINFDWGTGSPAPAIGADTFSTRWSGYLLVPETGTYTLSSLSSDGVRAYLNGVPVINNFNDQSTRWTDGQAISLTAGQKFPLLLEYYENTGSAVAKLKWTGPSFAGLNGNIIPQAYLFESNSSGGPDTTAPVISTLNPADSATHVAYAADLVATFSENIVRGTGDITIKNLSDGTQTVIPVTDTAQVTISGATMVINPMALFVGSKNYAVQIDATAIDDAAGLSFAGITNDTTWNFTTTSTWSTVNWTDDSALSFITSTNVTHSGDFVGPTKSAATINGFTFEAININGGFSGISNPYSGSNFTIGQSGGGGLFTYDAPAGVSGTASSALSDGLAGPNWGEVTVTYNLTGLLPNTNYEFYFFSADWTDSGRTGVLDGNDDGVGNTVTTDQSAGSGHDIIKYAYKTGASTSFTMTVNSSTGLHQYAFVNILTDKRPRATAQDVTTPEDTAKPITLAGTDLQGSPLTYTIVTQPASGTLSGTAPNLTYTPTTNFNGTDSFTFEVNNGSLDSATATVSITVTPVNDVPVFAVNPFATAGATESLAYIGQTLAGKATDADAGDTITYSKVSGPAWLAVAPNGTLSGTPPIGSAGLNTFSVSATDSAAAIATATLQITVTAQPLPLPWLKGDIGTGMLAGSVTHNAGTFTQAGSGTIGSTSDKFNFTYQTLTGDGEIRARISLLQDTGSASRVGVMIRDTLAANSKQIFMGMTSTNAYRWVRRTTTGGSATSSNSSTGTVPNTWVRLVRSGTTITAYKSSNGTTWTTVGSTTGTTFASTCYIGLAVSSGSTTTLNTSQFSNVTVTP